MPVQKFWSNGLLDVDGAPITKEIFELLLALSIGRDFTIVYHLDEPIADCLVAASSKPTTHSAACSNSHQRCEAASHTPALSQEVFCGGSAVPEFATRLPRHHRMAPHAFDMNLV